MAHAAAGAGADQNDVLGAGVNLKPNVGIITAYNDMLSAHQPFETYPQIIKTQPRVKWALRPRLPVVCQQCVTVSHRADREWNCH